MVHVTCLMMLLVHCYHVVFRVTLYDLFYHLCLDNNYTLIAIDQVNQHWHQVR